MTPMQARFVEEYLIDLNATQAAIRAGAKPNSAHVTGHRWLKKTNVAAAIAAAQHDRAERTGLTVDWVLQELDATYKHARLLGQPGSAITALVKLGEHIQMWPNKISVYDHRKEAEAVAAQLGISVDDVLAEAERLTKGT